jgi:hypothetical protein
MAGMVSALNMVILCELGSDPPTLRILCNRNALLCWNVGCLVFVIAMTVQGWREGLNPAVLFTANETTTFLYSLRLIAGLGMALPSFYWFFYSCSLEKRFKTQNTNERGAIQTLLEHG